MECSIVINSVISDLFTFTSAVWGRLEISGKPVAQIAILVKEVLTQRKISAQLPIICVQVFRTIGGYWFIQNKKETFT